MAIGRINTTASRRIMMVFVTRLRAALKAPMDAAVFAELAVTTCEA